MKKIIVYVALLVSSMVFSQNAFEKLEDNSLQEIDNERAAELIKNNNGNLLFKQDKKIKADIDLSIENINKQSLIELFTDW